MRDFMDRKHLEWAQRTTLGAWTLVLAIPFLLLSAGLASTRSARSSSLPGSAAVHQSHGTAGVKFKVLYSFAGGADGGVPSAGVVLDRSGNAYSTTQYGGDLTCNSGHGCGTVFKLDPTGKETVVHAFQGATTDGSIPMGDLLLDNKGNLYGTTYFGGGSPNCNGGCGTVFKLTPKGKKWAETVLYSFTSDPDGAHPSAGLVMDSDGNLYGTTQYGGASGEGTVFKLDTARNETILYSFQNNGVDGEVPLCTLLRDRSGNLYGTTYFGGSSTNCAGGCGTVFKLGSADNETILYNFTGGSDGNNPPAGLVRDKSGLMYGTAGPSPYFSGTVFKLDQNGTFSVVYDFGSGRPHDGGQPNARLLRGRSGNLYGTTAIGGYSDIGTVFKINNEGKETVLYNFLGGSDGGEPLGDLVMDDKGNLYGTASAYGAHGQGVVFKISPK
jgi:uncharacterized repeat protein (TIGR03803 family)